MALVRAALLKELAIEALLRGDQPLALRIARQAWLEVRS